MKHTPQGRSAPAAGGPGDDAATCPPDGLWPTGSPPAITTAEPARPAPTEAMASRSSPLLSFSVGGQAYGIDVLQVQEIRPYEPPDISTRARPGVGPTTVINLRGQLLPVFDLRDRLSTAPMARRGAQVLLVVQIRERVLGLVVDSVSGVTAPAAPATAEDKPAGRQDRPAPGALTSLTGDASRVGPSRRLAVLDLEALIVEAGLTPSQPLA